jgi:hypothetical protein
MEHLIAEPSFSIFYAHVRTFCLLLAQSSSSIAPHSPASINFGSNDLAIALSRRANEATPRLGSFATLNHA